MAEFRNPPVIDTTSGAPADDTILQYDLASDTWFAVSAASVGALLPQVHPSEPTQTSVDVAQTAPTQTSPWGFSTSAQGVAVLAQIDALVTDVASIITWADALQAKLVSSGILT